MTITGIVVYLLQDDMNMQFSIHEEELPRYRQPVAYHWIPADHLQVTLQGRGYINIYPRVYPSTLHLLLSTRMDEVHILSSSNIITNSRVVFPWSNVPKLGALRPCGMHAIMHDHHDGDVPR